MAPRCVGRIRRDSAEKRPTVQVGDFHSRKSALKLTRDPGSRCVIAIQDRGAGRADLFGGREGAPRADWRRINLDAVPKT